MSLCHCLCAQARATNAVVTGSVMVGAAAADGALIGIAAVVVVGAGATVGAADAVVTDSIIGGAAAADGAPTGIASAVAVGAGATVGAADAVVTGSVIGGAAADGALIGIASAVAVGAGTAVAPADAVITGPAPIRALFAKLSSLLFAPPLSPFFGIALAFFWLSCVEPLAAFLFP